MEARKPCATSHVGLSLIDPMIELEAETKSPSIACYIVLCVLISAVQC
jgi:hypothetical protein